MKFPLPDDFFPSVQLEQEEEERFLHLKDFVLQTHIDAYDEYAFIDRGTIDARQWKYLKKKDNLTAYRRRGRGGKKKKFFFSSSSSSSSCISSSVSMTCTSNLPSILVVGTIAGTLEDVMYGYMASTKEERTLRAAFTQDGVLDSSVLYTFEKPTQEHPFQSTAIKWSLKKTPGSPFVIKNRDFCFLGATGIAKCSNGERIGYELRHSVEFPSCPPLQDQSAVRGQLYICSIYRQIKPHVVEMYYKATYDGRGEILDLIASFTVVNTLLGAATRAIECAYAKKLMRALVKKKKMGIMNHTKKDYHEVKMDCTMCHQKIGRKQNEKNKKCALCEKYVCSACVIHKRLLMLPDTKSTSTLTTGISSINSRNDYQEVQFLLSSFYSISGSDLGRSASGIIADSRLSTSTARATTTATVSTKETARFRFCKACFVEVRSENAAHVAREEIIERLELEEAQAVFQQEKDEAIAEIESSRTMETKSRLSRKRSRARTLETINQTIDPRLLLAGYDPMTLSMNSNSSARSNSRSTIIGTLSTQSTSSILNKLLNKVSTTTISTNTYPNYTTAPSNTNFFIQTSDVSESNYNSTSNYSQSLFKKSTASINTGVGVGAGVNAGAGSSNKTSYGVKGGGTGIDDTRAADSVDSTDSIYVTPASSIPAPISLVTSVPVSTPTTNDLIPLVMDHWTLSQISQSIAIAQTQREEKKQEGVDLIEPMKEPEEDDQHIYKNQELSEKKMPENTYLLAQSQSSSLHGPFDSYLARSH